MSMQEKKITEDLFQPANLTSAEAEQMAQKSRTFWQDAMSRLFKNKAAVVGLAIIVLIFGFALLGPLLSSHTATHQDTAKANLPARIPLLEKIPFLGLDGHDTFGNDKYKAAGAENEYFWFGTDVFGRDQFVRVWEGTRISLYISFLAAVIDLLVGVIYGMVSGYKGGAVDNVMQRIIEVLVGIPQLIVVILLILVLDPGVISISIAMVITGWTTMARIVRGQVMKLKGQEFVMASKTLGANSKRILFKHMFPNVLASIVITSMFTIPAAIFGEAFLSFIGLGLQPPTASLGTLVNDGFKGLELTPHLVLFPSLIISLIMISFNMLGDGLRDALDPKMRK
ncbi:oligopeptide ABC transporter permease [Fictibacillus macauensis ZFHKF-1]|uniref:Oligopeptide ABC transporter permease n=1 Tax=Fictibacillus macauensis ZFHKF-1 TaxID=1196324 RepID=I8UCE9_9BACL|nr:oligopeptide ABC transporter permease [Fictibacillus macauensis]EIT84590.1 oligopeptide ABC transporter permease [Fictibacillus macauensis ZFHKF-1]